MAAARLFLHIGLPRTATTSLQQAVFPKLRRGVYLGKLPGAPTLIGKLSPEVARELVARHNAGDSAALADIRRLLPTIARGIKTANAKRDGEAATRLARLFSVVVAELCARLPAEWHLYSDESLVESMSGLAADTAFGDAVALEQILAQGELADSACVAVVLRDPVEFVRASYYKSMELSLSAKDVPMSFDQYIRRQLTIYLRQPSASRIFLAMHEPLVAHLRGRCRNLVVTHYESLIASGHVLDDLLGFPTGEEPFGLGRLERLNRSFRRDDAVAFILSAPGVPAGIAIAEYAASFPETLAHYGLDILLSESRLTGEAGREGNLWKIR